MRIKLLLLVLLLSPVLAIAQSGGSGTASSIYKTSFANLGTPADGSVRYCTNCNANTTPCTSGGTGAMASRINGAWSCAGAASGAPADATYITETASSSLSNEFPLASLATGVLKNTTITGVPSIASATDLNAPLYCADAGATDDYACNLSPAITGYATGGQYRFKANTANTGAATIALNGLAAITIVKVQGGITTALENNDIRAGQDVVVTYDGTNMQMQSQLGNAPTAISGLTTNTIPKATSATAIGDSSLSDNAGAVTQTSASATAFQTGPNGGTNPVFRIVNNTASQADGVSVTGLAAGSGVKFDALSSGSNSGFTFTPKGTGSWVFKAGSSTVLFEVQDSSANKFLSIDQASGAFRIRNDIQDLLSSGGVFNVVSGNGRILVGPSGSLEFRASSGGSVDATITRNAAGVLQVGTTTSNADGSILAANLGADLTIPMNNAVLAQATGTVYGSPGSVSTPLTITTEGNVSWPVPRAGTITNLYVRTGGTAKTNTPTTTITVRKNGADTALTLTMTETTNTTTSDTAHSFTVAAGDLITVSFSVAGAGAVSTSIAAVTMLLK